MAVREEILNRISDYVAYLELGDLKQVFDFVSDLRDKSRRSEVAREAFEDLRKVYSWGLKGDIEYFGPFMRQLQAEGWPVKMQEEAISLFIRGLEDSREGPDLQLIKYVKDTWGSNFSV